MSDLKFNEKKIAIMQGRLVNSEKKGEIQFFPKNNGRRNWNYSKKIILDILNGLLPQKI